MLTPLRLVGALTVLTLPALAQDPQSPPKPWRLQSQMPEDSWLNISGQIRLRYEGLEGQFRSASRLAGSDHLFFQRTQLRADAEFEPLKLTVEIMDSRHYGGGVGSAINASSVNALDLLQGYAEFDLGELGSGRHHVRAGRQTIDVGSRRLVARNNYRNTINSFTGVEWWWEDDKTTARAMWTMPVRRRPSDIASIVDNEIDLDDQDTDRQFLGAFVGHQVDENHLVEAYTFVLLEDVGRQRELITPGVRLLRKAKRGEIDYLFEGIYQFGDSRLSSGGPDLNHAAWFQTTKVGYTMDRDMSPRFQVSLDYASGDRDPGDGDNNRFETLFGARRWEYGPTGIFGAVARANILSPELRFGLKPQENMTWFLAWRGIWLASEQDAWTAAGVTDATGASGRHVGQQFETRFRWDIEPKSLRLEGGLAYIFGGSFQDDAPGGQGDDSAYGYVQFAWTF